MLEYITNYRWLLEQGYLVEYSHMPYYRFTQKGRRAVDGAIEGSGNVA